MFEQYQANPNSVDETWRYFFEGIELGSENVVDVPKSNAPQLTVASTSSTAGTSAQDVSTIFQKEFKAIQLIEAYKRFGHLQANVNPLSTDKTVHPMLDLKNFGLTSADLNSKFHASAFIGLQVNATLKEIVDKLTLTYCSTIGVEFDHITDVAMKTWLTQEFETGISKISSITKEQKVRILERLTAAECFERFIHTRFVAKKRFSLEGGDALVPMMDSIVDEASNNGATDIVLGMAHRGRLNLLTNIFGKKYEYIFSEFDGKLSVEGTLGTGDVKYHMGYSKDYQTRSGKTMHLSMASNPSHLEFVNPVIEGMTRAKQKQRMNGSGSGMKYVIPMQIHGDAAFAGQGINYETIQLSGVEAYQTGGTIHIIVNNQIGFTALPTDSRATLYSSDLVKIMNCPVFHVNGDDPEACEFVARLATKFRQKFNRSVMIDIICFRKYGHNEGDEPSFTQPTMYKVIKDHVSTREIYAKKLSSTGVLDEAGSKSLVDQMNATLQASYDIAKAGKIDEGHNVSKFEGAWKGFRQAKDEDFQKLFPTGVDEKTLREIGKVISTWPKDFTPHSKLTRLIEQRGQMVEKGEGLDWGCAEALSFGSLLWEGTHVRITGQDSERGTFSHRHSVLYDFNNGKKYTPLNNLKTSQAHYAVFNSVLSEAAVLGFEYGFAWTEPKALVIWEAQFGDFANGAQVIIDQFIAAAEQKWLRMNGLTMLLPHGYEGQGPEHSSARMERYLQLCAQNNIQVCYPTTPAQIFHLFRRQVRREFRKPLIVMTPKSLLRLPEAVSKLTDLTTGGYQDVIADEVQNPRKIIFCTGRIYYDLLKARLANPAAQNVALVRVEQLYPWPANQVEAVLRKYSSAKEVLWVQEEPKNMGAWHFVRDYIASQISMAVKFQFCGRDPQASPAVGSEKVHEKEQKHIIEEALK